jgi:hypothetical protein
VGFNAWEDVPNKNLGRCLLDRDGRVRLIYRMYFYVLSFTKYKLLTNFTCLSFIGEHSFSSIKELESLSIYIYICLYFIVL